MEYCKCYSFLMFKSHILPSYSNILWAGTNKCRVGERCEFTIDLLDRQQVHLDQVDAKITGQLTIDLLDRLFLEYTSLNLRKTNSFPRFKLLKAPWFSPNISKILYTIYNKIIYFCSFPTWMENRQKISYLVYLTDNTICLLFYK
jgi:hypothetical protein